MRELIDTYYAYQQWANRRILDTAEQVPFEQLTIQRAHRFRPGALDPDAHAVGPAALAAPVHGPATRP